MYPDCKNQMSNQNHTAVAMETMETSEIQLHHRLQNISRSLGHFVAKIKITMINVCIATVWRLFFDIPLQKKICAILNVMGPYFS